MLIMKYDCFLAMVNRNCKKMLGLHSFNHLTTTYGSPVFLDFNAWIDKKNNKKRMNT